MTLPLAANQVLSNCRKAAKATEI